MKRSVGIILRHGNLALLQKRGDWNWETGGPHSFPGLLQVTAHGGCQSRESWEQALFREIGEELGPDLESWVRARAEHNELILVRESVGPQRCIRTYAVKRSLGAAWLRRIRLAPETGGVIPWPLDQIATLQPVPENRKVEPLPIGYMFADEIEALKGFAARLGTL